MGRARNLAVKRKAAPAVGAAAWILNLVQEDEQEMSGALARAMESIR